MSLSQLLNRDVVIVQRSSSGATDELGDPIAGETLVETVGELQQQQRSEGDDEGERSDTRWLLILPAGTDIDTGDKVLVDDQRYEVVGAPWEARNPRTRAESHIEATLQRVAGSENAS